jgi:hypothetical protein
MARLENWVLHTRNGLDGKPFKYLTGNVFGHPKADLVRKDLTDGHEIITSNIVSLDLENSVAITKSGTVYELCNKSNM